MDSQMQKIVLQHPDRTHHEDGRPYYLNASSIGSPKIERKIPLRAAMDRSPLLEYRVYSKKVSIMDLMEAADDDEEEEDYYGNEALVGFESCSQLSYPIPTSIDSDVNPRKVPTVLSHPCYDNQTNVFVIKVKNVFEKLSPAEEEARLRVVYLEDHYDRKLSLSEFVHRRCEDVKQPMEDEEGPIQLRLAQHSPIRMRCRLLKDVSPEDHDDQEDEEVDSMEDKLPKIPTKPNPSFNRSQKPTVGAHKTKAKCVKLLSRAMGLEAELPHDADVRTAHDNEVPQESPTRVVVA
ncbi:hypothetical protein BGX31_002481 [Mortierella sp. GBA43]|nr:hypothetical protein BGX31_002481 [Mortierella sp. GBA43]